MCGAIMLNHTMDKVLLVKGWGKSGRWMFPRGKINKDEEQLDCAVREVGASHLRPSFCRHTCDGGCRGPMEAECLPGSPGNCGATDVLQTFEETSYDFSHVAREEIYLEALFDEQV